MLRRTRTLVALTLTVIGTLALLAVPASAQQLVDAGKEGDGSGGLAFVVMVVVIFGIAGTLFFLDHVRRNRLPEEED
jgi:hypothetical protein